MPILRRVFIIVPSASMASPVSGAIALANALCSERAVTFVSLKSASKGCQPFVDMRLDEKVQVVSLGEIGGWLKRLLALRRLMSVAGSKKSVAAISFGLSADLINSFCCNHAITCSSVRGNLPMVYPTTYGKFGGLVTLLHFSILRRMKYVVSMTQSMAKVVQSRIARLSPVIGNFVDETLLLQFRRELQLDGPFRFIFTGSMSSGKQPHLVLQALSKLQHQGYGVRLDVYGDGPLLQKLKEQTLCLPKPEMVSFHGYVNRPFEDVANADAMVLPSLTEGVSRSALEALFLGVPCVMRNVDGNAELIQNGENGMLFAEDDELADAMLRTALMKRKMKGVKCLIPPAFRQITAVREYLHLLEGSS